MGSSGNFPWGPEPFTLSNQYSDPSTVIKQLQVASTKGQKMVLNMTGGSHERYKTDGKFDFAKWKARMDLFNTPEMKEAVREGVANGTIVMNNVMDEPQIKDWGGSMTKPRLDEMAAYVKAIFPTLPVGVVARWDWRPEERYQVIDVILAQYQWNKGDVVAYRDNVLARGRLEGVEILFSLNLLGGGIYSWITKECPIPLTGGPGPYLPVCKVTPEQLRDWGRILGVAGCGMTLWRYDAEFWANEANVQAMRDVAATLSTVPARPCRRLDANAVPPPPNIPPTAAFDPPICTVGVACQFHDESSDPDGTLRAWNWEFGGGASSSENNPSHTFTTSGSHNVTLEVTDDAGGTALVARTVVVEEVANSPPNAAFDSPSCTAGVACPFTDGSSDADGTLSTWRWDFGDGGSSSRQNPSRTYASEGSYSVSLEVTDDDGGSSAITQTVTVEAGSNIRPTAAFEPPSCTAKEPCQFTDGSGDADGALSTWSWEFGDGTVSTETHPSHTFATSGSHSVTLEVMDDAGGTDDVTRTVTVAPPPNSLPSADFDPPSCTAEAACQFTDRSSDEDGTLSAWTWDFGDGGGGSALQNPSRTYAQPGSYEVTLTVMDDAGGTDEIIRTVTVDVKVNSPPVAAFDTPSCRAATACQFTDGSSDEDGTLSQWSWDFGDGGSSELPNPVQTYPAAGTYSVTLRVTDDAGGTDAVTRAVTVLEANSPPTAAFTPPSCTAGAACQFTDGSSDEDGTLSQWSWDFGDGGSSTLRNPTRTYASPGTYTVTLSVTDDDLATGQQTGSVVVAAAPVAIALTVSGRVDATKQYMTLNWTSTPGSSVDVYRNGPFLINTPNDGKYTNSRKLPGAPSYTYKVCQVGTSICSNEATVTFAAAPNTAPNANFAVQCNGLGCSFTDTSTDADGVIKAWNWVFGDGSTSTARNPIRTYAAGGTYNVTLKVTDDDGATHQRTASVTVGSITLTASGRVDATKQYMALSWKGAGGTMVNVYRNGTLIKNTENDGKYTNSRIFTGPAIYIYKVCETATAKCSNTATVVFN